MPPKSYGFTGTPVQHHNPAVRYHPISSSICSPAVTHASQIQSRRRQELELLHRMNPTIEKLTAAVEQEAKRPEVIRLITILAWARLRHFPVC